MHVMKWFCFFFILFIVLMRILLFYDKMEYLEYFQFGSKVCWFLVFSFALHFYLSNNVEIEKKCVMRFVEIQGSCWINLIKRDVTIDLFLVLIKLSHQNKYSEAEFLPFPHVHSKTLFHSNTFGQIIYKTKNQMMTMNSDTNL